MSQEGVTVEQPSAAFSSLNVPAPPKPKKKKGAIAKQNELLDKACSFLTENVYQASQNTPSVNPTALYWSSKLDKMHPTQRFYAERFINDILLEAELGNLNRNSVKINVQEYITTPSPTHSPYVYNPPTPCTVPIPSPGLVNIDSSSRDQSSFQGDTTMAPIYIVNPSTSTNSSASGTKGLTSQLLMRQSVNPAILQGQEEPEGQMNCQKFYGNKVNNYNDAQEGRQPSNENATLSALFSSFSDF